jgi:hypothetical protein
MTPPTGAMLFYMRGIVPAGATMTDVYRAMHPFACCRSSSSSCASRSRDRAVLPKAAGLLD